MACTRFWEDFRCGDQLLCSQFPSLYRVVIVKILLILVICSSYLFSWNLDFHCNLIDLDNEDLGRLMSTLIGY